MISERITTVFFGLLLLSGCASPPAPVPAPAPAGAPLAGPAPYVYQCEGDYRFAARFEGDRLLLDDRMGSHSLERVISASGARYEGEGMLFWSKGLLAILETPDANHAHCVGQAAEDVREIARLLGYSYRGVGQEPGWLVEIDPEREMRLLLDYGTLTIHTSPPRREGSTAAAPILFRASAGGEEVLVTITPVPCEDTMSGEAFPTRVQLRIDGSEHQGCGTFLEGSTALPLTGTPWKLMDLHDVPALAPSEGSPPQLHFDAVEGRLSGSSGCNQLSATYLREGDRFRLTGPPLLTRRACLETGIMEQEQEFVSMLEEARGLLIWGEVLTVIDADQNPIAHFVAMTES